MTCPHNYTNLTRKGRADYRCRLCGADITMELVLMADSDERGNHGGSSKRDNRRNDEMNLSEYTEARKTDRKENSKK